MDIRNDLIRRIQTAQAHGYSRETIAGLAGVSKSWLDKFLTREDKTYNLHQVQELSNALDSLK